MEGGILKSRKGVNLPRLNLRLPSMTEKDKQDLEFGLSQGVDWVSLSFVRKGEDIKEKSEFKNYKPANLRNALLLEGLYSEPPQIAPDAEARIERNFQGWFRYTILEKLYSLENRQEDLLALEEEQSEVAGNALIKLILLAFLPLIGGLIGVVLLIFLLVQWLLRQQRSLLFLDDSLAWQTKWGGETLWSI